MRPNTRVPRQLGLVSAGECEPFQRDRLTQTKAAIVSFTAKSCIKSISNRKLCQGPPPFTRKRAGQRFFLVPDTVHVGVESDSIVCGGSRCFWGALRKDGASPLPGPGAVFERLEFVSIRDIRAIRSFLGFF